MSYHLDKLVKEENENEPVTAPGWAAAVILAVTIAAGSLGVWWMSTLGN